MSLYGTLCLLKSVLNSASARGGGGSAGFCVGVTEGTELAAGGREEKDPDGMGVSVAEVLSDGDRHAVMNNMPANIRFFKVFISE
jgi:hypothetical protein